MVGGGGVASGCGLCGGGRYLNERGRGGEKELVFSEILDPQSGRHDDQLQRVAVLCIKRTQHSRIYMYMYNARRSLTSYNTNLG